MELYKRSEKFRDILSSIANVAKKVGGWVSKIPGFGGGDGDEATLRPAVVVEH